MRNYFLDNKRKQEAGFHSFIIYQNYLCFYCLKNKNCGYSYTARFFKKTQ